MAVDNQQYEMAYNELQSGDVDGALRILLEIFDGADANTAVSIANIYSVSTLSHYNPSKALEYYEIAADGGNGYANYKLGSHYYRLGKIEEALSYYTRGANAGVSECAYCSYALLLKLHRPEEAVAMRALAIKLGHPFAARDKAIETIRGESGILSVPLGLFRLVALAPAIIRRARKSPAYQEILKS